MPEEALIRVRLDTQGAESDLERLYGKFRGAPGVNVPGGGGGGPGGGGSGGGGGGGAGAAAMIGGGGIMGMAMKLLALAPVAAVAAPTIKSGMAVAGGVLGEFGTGIDPFAGAAGASKGRRGLADELAQKYGMAYGLGLVGDDTIRDVYNFREPFAAAEGEGRANVRKMLAYKEVSGDNANDVLNRLSGVLDRLATATESVVSKFGG